MMYSIAYMNAAHLCKKGQKAEREEEEEREG